MTAKGGSNRVFGPRGVAQLGRALRSGRRGRRFKSSHPDHSPLLGGLRGRLALFLVILGREFRDPAGFLPKLRLECGSARGAQRCAAAHRASARPSRRFSLCVRDALCDPLGNAHRLLAEPPAKRAPAVRIQTLARERREALHLAAPASVAGTHIPTGPSARTPRSSLWPPATRIRHQPRRSPSAPPSDRASPLPRRAAPGVRRAEEGAGAGVVSALKVRNRQGASAKLSSSLARPPERRASAAESVRGESAARVGVDALLVARGETAQSSAQAQAS